MSKARNVPLYSKNWLLDSFRVRQRVSAVFSGQSSTFCTFLLKYEVELNTILPGLSFSDALTPYFTTYTEILSFFVQTKFSGRQLIIR